MVPFEYDQRLNFCLLKQKADKLTSPHDIETFGFNRYNRLIEVILTRFSTDYAKQLNHC